jgi:glyoxylate reductase
MKKIFVTRDIPNTGIELLKVAGHEVIESPKHGPLTKDELIAELKKNQYDAVISLLTDMIDKDVYDAAPQAKIFSNYAVGFNNFDIEEAKKRNILLTNTPGVLTEAVAEFSFALLLTFGRKTIEADTFMRAGKYHGWDPDLFLGLDLKGKTMGIAGGGRIGSHIAHIAKGFGMNVIYYDVVRNEKIESELGVHYFENIDEMLKVSDVVNLCVPLLDSTKHLMNKDRLALMKKTAILINTSRGPVVDENALVEALKNKVIAGACLDVFEFEPDLAQGLKELPNTVLTPHIASATEFARSEMSRLAAQNIIDALEGKRPKNMVY